MGTPTVAAGFPRAFLDFAVTRGADRQKLLARSHISPDDLLDHDNRIPLQNYVSLLKAGIEFCQDPALALLFGETVRMHDISIVGLIGEVADSAESGRQQINRYARLLIDDGGDAALDRIVFIHDKETFWMKFTSPVYVDHPLITESGFARCICSARALFRSSGIPLKPPFPKSIHFTYAEPSHRAEYDRVFGVPLVFNSHMNALQLDEEVCSATPPRTHPYLSRVLVARAEKLLGRLESSKSTRDRVEGLLVTILHTGEASIETIANRLGFSRQTLFRKLKAEGVTYEQVLDELRQNLALKYLREKKTSVSETAYWLGFSDPAAFSRAFKRWTGSSPRDVKAANGRQ